VALESLSRTGCLTLRVWGTSMLPAVPPGSEVRVRGVRPDAVKAGDVVLVRVPGGVRLHRLVHVLEDGRLLLRGDHHAFDDPPVDAVCLLGVVEGVSRGRPKLRVLERLRALLPRRVPA